MKKQAKPTILEALLEHLLGPSDPSLAESEKTPMDDIVPPEFLKAPYVGRCTICKSRDTPSPAQEALCAYWSCEGHCREYHGHMQHHIRWDGKRIIKTSMAHAANCVCVVCRAKAVPLVDPRVITKPTVPEFGKVEEIDAEFPVDDEWAVTHWNGRKRDSGRISLPKELGGTD